jgi:predicted Na+-dependent transporter
MLAYLFLLLIPFGVSRVLRRYEIIKDKMQKYIPLASKIATFLIVLYIFSLQNIHGVFDQNLGMVMHIFIAVFVSYLIVFALSYALYRYQNNMTDFSKSFFWNSTIRFITLGIVFGVMYIPYL